MTGHFCMCVGLIWTKTLFSSFILHSCLSFQRLCRLLREFILTYLLQRRHLATVASANISWYLTGHSHVEQTAVSIGILIKIGSYTPMILNCRYHVYGIIVSDISLKTRPRCFGLHYCPRMFTFIFNHFYAMCPGSYRVR